MNTNDNPTEKFENIADQLKAGLGMIDSDEYDRMKEMEEAERMERLLHTFHKDFDNVNLNEDELAIISDITETLPDAFFKGLSSDRSDFLYDYGTVQHLANQHPDVFKRFMRKLSTNDVVTNADDFLFPENELENQVNVLIEELLELVQHGDEDEVDEASQLIWDRFANQSHDCQIRIIKSLLSADEDNRDYCYWNMLMEWWDEAVIPDIERAWKKRKDPLCVRVIAYRFPKEYVLAHQEEIGKKDYVALCLRLAAEEGFVIDKKRLTRAQYCRIVAHNHILLESDEAESLLFGHILQCLQSDHQPPEDYWNRWNESCCRPSGFLHGTCKDFLSAMLSQKPSLTYLPGVTYIIRCLKYTGNNKAIMKFLLWNHNLQDSIPTFLSEQNGEASILQNLPELYIAYMAHSWDQLLTLAERTFHLVSNEVISHFRKSPVTDRDFSNYEPY